MNTDIYYDKPIIVYEDEFGAWMEKYAPPPPKWWQFIARFRQWRNGVTFEKRIASVWNGKWSDHGL